MAKKNFFPTLLSEDEMLKNLIPSSEEEEGSDSNSDSVLESSDVSEKTDVVSLDKAKRGRPKGSVSKRASSDVGREREPYTRVRLSANTASLAKLYSFYSMQKNGRRLTMIQIVEMGIQRLVETDCPELLSLMKNK